MLDIIIPTYKNLGALKRTLDTIQPQVNDNIIVTVIDDGSQLDYSSIREMYHWIRLYELKENSGPGNARQYGIFNTKEPYLMFIDSGDILYYGAIDKILNAIQNNNSQIWVYYWPHFQEIDNKPSPPTNNRLHGRVYQRDFIVKNDIHFCPAGSYLNEDIGFNRTIRILIEQDERIHHIQRKLSFDDPIMEWTYDESSITNSDSGRSVCIQQNNALALNEIHVFQWACAHNIDADLIEKEICQIMTEMYYSVIRVSYEQPQGLAEAWAGAYKYYTNVFRDNARLESDCLTSYVGKQITRIYNKRNKWPNFSRPINFRRFLSKLENQTFDFL